MTKFNDLKVKRGKSNLKYTESKLVKKRPLSYRYHAEKGITLKGNTQKGITQRGNTQKGNTQKSIAKNAICKMGIT